MNGETFDSCHWPDILLELSTLDFHSLEMSKMTSKKVYTPLLPPSTIYEDDPRAVLTVAEQSLYDEVLAHFTTQPVYVLPGVETGELQEQEKFWLSRECILRCVGIGFHLCYCLTLKFVVFYALPSGKVTLLFNDWRILSNGDGDLGFTEMW